MEREIKDIKTLDYETLFDLFCIQNYSDSVIAHMYDVDKNVITKMRRKWGISYRDGFLIRHKDELNKLFNDYEQEIRTKIMEELKE